MRKVIKQSLKLLLSVKNLVYIVYFLAIVFNFTLTNNALAQDFTGLQFANNTGLGDNDPRDTVASLIQIIMGFLGTVAVCLILLGGFKWMMAMGNDDKVNEAKQTLASGFVGLLIVLSAYGITHFVIEQLVDATTY